MTDDEKTIEWAERRMAEMHRTLDEMRREISRMRGLREADRALIGEASEAWAVLTGQDPQSGRPSGSCVTEAQRVVAERGIAARALRALYDSEVSGSYGEFRLAFAAAKSALEALEGKR